MPGKPRALTREQIEEGKELRKQHGLTKAELAEYFGVGKTTVWENIFSTSPRVRIQHKRAFRRNICIPCQNCGLCMTNIIKDHHIPINLQIGEVCLKCFLESYDMEMLDFLEIANKMF